MPERPKTPATKKRRTPGEAKAARQLKEKEKKDKAQAHNDWINNIAHLEQSMQKQDMQTALDANHPPPSMQQKAPHHVSTATTAPPVTEETINNNAMALKEEPMTLDNSNNEYELVKVKKKRQPSTKGTGGLRSQVNTARQATQQGGEVQETESNKQKAPISLRSNWDAPDIELPPADTVSHCRSTSTGSAISIASTVSQNTRTPSKPTEEPEESDNEMLGGISDDTAVPLD
ncbi:hypothetical protein DXG01_012133 [Tephrocybe rancida]|nr:hypothetical protein DXG01_012133 [Tephrocybe rancida]